MVKVADIVRTPPRQGQDEGVGGPAGRRGSKQGAWVAGLGAAAGLTLTARVSLATSGTLLNPLLAPDLGLVGGITAAWACRRGLAASPPRPRVQAAAWLGNAVVRGMFLASFATTSPAVAGPAAVGTGVAVGLAVAAAWWLGPRQGRPSEVVACVELLSVYGAALGFAAPVLLWRAASEVLLVGRLRCALAAGASGEERLGLHASELSWSAISLFLSQIV
ncbi:MAG TPA: hypothetical protein VFH51_12880 [Myxococcota bacterium]|nr:hypothetical protein [Myxococcota bacterium]